MPCLLGDHRGCDSRRILRHGAFSKQAVVPHQTFIAISRVSADVGRACSQRRFLRADDAIVRGSWQAAVIARARGFRAMGSPPQSIDNFVDPLTLAVVIGLVAAVVWLLSVLGNLPGRIASERGHPHTGAISVLGWLGLLIIVLWPVALVWA